jgi:hypothetical protein
MRRRVMQLAVPVFAIALCSCAADIPVVEAKGECGTAFGGELCSWARVQGDNIVEVGTTISLATFENAPADDHMDMSKPPVPSAVLNLADNVQKASGLKQFTFFWEAMGHPPAAFETPHFDFHFYMIPEAERMAIDCRDTTKPTDLPAGYVLPDEKLPPEIAKVVGVEVLIGVCIPTMGMHSLPAADFDAKTPFRGDMVVGYWKGKPIFIEPMISKAMLMEKKSFELTIPTIPGLTGPHPTVFRADYDERAQAYKFVFSGFTTS